jgi:hypothetical protein
MEKTGPSTILNARYIAAETNSCKKHSSLLLVIAASGLYRGLQVRESPEGCDTPSAAEIQIT